MPTPASDSVFINCPFDLQYQPLFEAVVFCVAACGFLPRCTLELADAGEVRIENIYRLIAQCNLSVHDISRTEATGAYHLPRFNMPLELGIFLGAKRFGRARKRCLILDRAPHRYVRFISDIRGQDIQAHENSRRRAIRRVRDWLRVARPHAVIPGGTRIWEKYEQFRRELPIVAEEAELDPTQLIFIDYLHVVTTWLERNR
jgi:hypothetical protein